MAVRETAARPIHHNAVMLIETLCSAANASKCIAPGQANQKHELEVDPLATIELPSDPH